jgi:hypothetical protein
MPIAYAYEADYHCPACTEARFGRCRFTREIACSDERHADPAGGELAHLPALDRESNAVGALFPWDEWYEVSEPGVQYLSCGDCGAILDTCEPVPDNEPECECESCVAAAEYGHAESAESDRAALEASEARAMDGAS